MSSTRLPPAPKAAIETKKPRTIQLGEAPATMANMALRKREQLKASFRPMISAPPPCSSSVCPLPSVGFQYPEQCSDQHASVGGESQAVVEGWPEFRSSLTGDDRLCDKNQTIGHVTKASQTEELQMEICPANLVDSLFLISSGSEQEDRTDVVDKSHLRIESRVNIVHRKELSLDGIGISRDNTTKTALSRRVSLFIAVSLDIAHASLVELFLT